MAPIEATAPSSRRTTTARSRAPAPFPGNAIVSTVPGNVHVSVEAGPLVPRAAIAGSARSTVAGVALAGPATHRTLAASADTGARPLVAVRASRRHPPAIDRTRRHRDTLDRWTEQKGRDGVKTYWEERNGQTIDGYPTGIGG